MKRYGLALHFRRLTWIGAAAFSISCATPREQAAGTLPVIALPTAHESAQIIRTELRPGIVELSGSRFAGSSSVVRIRAEIRDGTGQVTEAKLQFVHLPWELPMKRVSGNLWSAELSSKQLQKLAVQGRVISYEANIIARCDDGSTAVGTEPVLIAVSSRKPRRSNHL